MIEQIIKEMIIYFDKDIKRINHALKVYSFCSTIGRLEQLSLEELFVVELSGVLHDIGIKEAERLYNSSAGPYQEKEGPAIAARIMEELNIDQKVIERVKYIIGHHHSYNKIDGNEFQILVEADFLVNAFEDEFNKEALSAVRNKYFRTQAGIRLFNSMYPQ